MHNVAKKVQKGATNDRWSFSISFVSYFISFSIPSSHSSLSLSPLLLINSSSPPSPFPPPHPISLYLSLSFALSLLFSVSTLVRISWRTRMSSSPTENQSWVWNPSLSLSLTLLCSLLHLPLTLPSLAESSWNFLKQPTKTTTPTRTWLVLQRLHLGSIPCVILHLHVSDPLLMTLSQITTKKLLGSYVNLYTQNLKWPISWFLESNQDFVVVLGSISFGFKYVWWDCECCKREKTDCYVSWLRWDSFSYSWRSRQSLHNPRGFLFSLPWLIFFFLGLINYCFGI